MANDIDAEIKQQLIGDAVRAYANKETLPVGAMSTNITKDFKEDGDTVVVRLLKGAGKARFNTKNWRSSNVVRGAIKVILHRITCTASFNVDEIGRGERIRAVADELMSGCIGAIMQLLERELKPCTAINVGSADAFSHKVLNTKAWKDIKQKGVRPSVYLASDYYSRLLPSDALSLGTQQSSTWANIGNYDCMSAAPNFAGLVVNPGAFALANRLPMEASPDFKACPYKEVFEAPDLGISFLYTEWDDPDTRERACSMDTLIGIGRAAEFNSIVLTNDGKGFVPDLIEGVDEIPDEQEAA